MKPEKYLSKEDHRKFWDIVSEDKEHLGAEMAKLPFEKKVEITEQMQKDQWEKADLKVARWDLEGHYRL